MLSFLPCFISKITRSPQREERCCYLLFSFFHSKIMISAAWAPMVREAVVLVKITFT